MRRKLVEDLTVNEILELYRKAFRKGFSRRYRIPLDSTGTIPEKVLCHVYIDVFTGEPFRYWLDNKKSFQKPFDFDEILLVSYNATA